MDYTRLDVPLFCDTQKGKDCKKLTPDYIPPKPEKGIAQVGFTAKDKVTLDGAVSLVNKTILTGEYVFDSYDKYDNTCYVISNTMTWCVLLSDLTLIVPKIKK